MRNYKLATPHHQKKFKKTAAAPVAVVQEEALQLTEALPLEVSPYAEWIKLQLFFLISLGQTSTRTISRDITLVSPPVLSEAQDILRNLRLLVQNHALPPPPYDSVTVRTQQIAATFLTVRCLLPPLPSPLSYVLLIYCSSCLRPRPMP